jgi:hypothetical protein
LEGTVAGEKPLVKYIVSNYMTGLNMVQEGLGIAIMSELSLVHLPKNVLLRNIEPPGNREIRLAVFVVRGLFDCRQAIY